MPSFLYYISGHGYGHARRSAYVARVLKALRPDVAIHIRSAADRACFDGVPARFAPVAVDRGAIEVDSLNINWTASIGVVRELIGGRVAMIADEVRYIREHDVQLIVADVPFMAGHIAAAAGVPCYAQCNFMWDWIYQPHTDDRQLLDFIAHGYRHMAGWLRLPFPHECEHFGVIEDTPFVYCPPTLPAEAVRKILGINDSRPVVFMAMRGGSSPQTLAGLTRLADYTFIAQTGKAEANVIPWLNTLSFGDILPICDVVVSKPGHGIVTDCCATGCSLLYPPRNGFREDAMILDGMCKYARVGELLLVDYEAGNLGARLESLLKQPKPQPASNIDGATWLANWIAQRI